MKLLIKILSILLIITTLSCERKPLYLQGEYLLNVTVQTQADIDSMWDMHWRDSLKFDWKPEYGPIGYTAPENTQVVVFQDNTLLWEQTIKVNKRQYIDIDPNQTYDLLLYNKTLSIETEYNTGGYYVISPSIDENIKSSISEQYTSVNQPGEIFSTYLKNIYLNDIDYEIVFENGRNIYVYNIDATLNPVSYIYVIQFIVVNDDHTTIEAKDISGFTISGVTSKKNLLTSKSIYTGHNQVVAFDVKDGQMFGDSLIFASRITVLDLLPEQEGSSWDTHENYLYYTIMNIDTYNYGMVSGTKDITKQIKQNPYGGVLTVIILNSELKRKDEESEEGFGINLNEWKSHEFEIPY